jgi:hypothetical protein
VTLVVTPDAPPALNERAARALLALLLDALRDKEADRVEHACLPPAGG